ncbi:MAG TPA: hypothetical protein VF796_00965 [Humisphaera sp.]
MTPVTLIPARIARRASRAASRACLPLLATAGLLVGCTQNNPPPPAELPGPASAPAEPAGRVGRSPTVPKARPDLLKNRERETSTQVLAFPTGDRETSVILLEKRFPTQSRLGKPYRYELKVTNLTDWPVAGVVVREDFPATFTVSAADATASVAPPMPAAPAVPTTRSTDVAATTRPAASEGLPTLPENLASATRPTAPPVVPGRDLAGPDLRYADGVGYYRDVAGVWPATEKRAERRGTIARELIVGSLEARGSRVIPVAGASDEPGGLDTRTTVTYAPVLAGGTYVINPILQLLKEGPRHADLCDPIEVRYVVANTGTGTETDVRIEEPLPEGLTTMDGQRVVRLSVGDLPDTQAREFRVKLRALRTGEFSSRASARGAGTATQSGDVVTAVHAPKLTAVATGPASEYVGKTAGYDVVVTNVGDAAARNAFLTAAADAGAVVGIADPNAAGDRLSLGTIEPGGTRKVRVTAKPTVGGGAMTVRATAKSDCADAVTATYRTSVQVIAATGLEVVNRDDPARVGEPVRLQVTVQNTGSGPDRNVKVVATLPPQLTYGSATGPTQGRVAGQQVVFEPLKELGPGQTATWTIEAKAAQAGDARVKVELSSETLSEPVTQTQPTRVY